MNATISNPSVRSYFLDNLRLFLVILVVVHHVALVYGAGAPFYYTEPPVNDAFTFKWLLVFLLVNQSWFMGAFFLLAGYFTPGSFDRKGNWMALKDRFIRLGIPLVFFFFVLNPISSLGFYQMPASMTGNNESPTWKNYPDMIGMGPMWFVAMLLFFTLGYLLLRKIFNNRKVKLPRKLAAIPVVVWLPLFVLILAGLSYLIRIRIPIGKALFGFPTLAYLPQYLLFFVMGIVAFRKNWLKRMNLATCLAGFGLALVAVLFLFPLAFSGQWFNLNLGPLLGKALGKGYWQSAVYASWDSLFAVGLCLGLIPLFRRFFNWNLMPLSQLGYAVFVLHIPKLVGLAVFMKDYHPGAMIKFGVMSVFTLIACFGAAWVVRRIPGVSRVL